MGFKKTLVRYDLMLKEMKRMPPPHLQRSTPGRSARVSVYSLSNVYAQMSKIFLIRKKVRSNNSADRIPQLSSRTYATYD